eukprot:4235627-Pleurochrysis_carterae.AAC.1
MLADADADARASRALALVRTGSSAISLLHRPSSVAAQSRIEADSCSNSRSPRRSPAVPPRNASSASLCQVRGATPLPVHL